MNTMNKQNALRFFLAKIKKGHITPDLVSHIQSHIGTKYCIDCSFEDFGYCSLRTSKFSSAEIIETYCKSSIAVYIDNVLNFTKHIVGYKRSEHIKNLLGESK